MTEHQLKQLREYEWLEQNYNLILLGPPCAGKTLLSVGLGIEANQKGFQVSFATMGELIHLLKTEKWTEVIGNQGMITAILDRLLHRVEVIHMNNESLRLKKQQKIFKE